MSKRTLKKLAELEDVASDYLAREFYEKVDKALRSHHATLLKAFQAWAPKIGEVTKEKIFGERQVVHVIAMATALIVTEKTGDKQLPEWFLPYLQLTPYLEIYNCFSPCQRACALLPPAMVREAILDAQQARWEGTNIIGLLSCIPGDAETITHVVREMSVGERQTEEYSQQLRYLGEPLLAAAEAVWADDLWKGNAQALLMALHRLKLPESAGLFVRALGHKSKPVQAFAQTGLADLGSQARAALEAGTTAKKKAIRVFCSERLAFLGPASGDGETGNSGDTEGAGARGFQGLPPDEQTRMLERVDAVRLSKKKPAFFKEMKEAPALWFEAMVEVLGQSVGRDDIQHLIAETLRRPDFEDEVPVFWGIYLRFLARHNIRDSYNQWQLMKHIAMLPSDLDPGVFDRAYLGAAGPFTTKLLPHYFAHVQPASTALIVQGLKHSSKPVREAAVTATSDLTESLEPLVALLKERKKATRIAIGQALCRAEPKLVSPHKKLLEATLKTEKVDEVQSLMQTALARL